MSPTSTGTAKRGLARLDDLELTADRAAMFELAVQSAMGSATWRSVRCAGLTAGPPRVWRSSSIWLRPLPSRARPRRRGRSSGGY